MIAYCGIKCTECEAYIATATADEAMRERVAAEWSVRYSKSLSAADINCTGCHGSGVKLGYCEHGCPIRACAKSKVAQTCAECPSYACDKVQFVLQAVPQAKAELEQLRRQASKN